MCINVYMLHIYVCMNIIYTRTYISTEREGERDMHSLHSDPETLGNEAPRSSLRVELAGRVCDPKAV